MRDEIAVLRHTVVGRENPGVRCPRAQEEDKAWEASPGARCPGAVDIVFRSFVFYVLHYRSCSRSSSGSSLGSFIRGFLGFLHGARGPAGQQRIGV